MSGESNHSQPQRTEYPKIDLQWVDTGIPSEDINQSPELRAAEFLLAMAGKLDQEEQRLGEAINGVAQAWPSGRDMADPSEIGTDLNPAARAELHIESALFKVLDDIAVEEAAKAAQDKDAM